MAALTDFISSLDVATPDQPWESGEPFGLGQVQKGFLNDIPPLVHDPAIDEKPELQPNQNAAQAWKAQAAQMQAGVGQIQQQNRNLLKPQSDSTSRYYTRQLYRELMKSRDPETRMQARLGLRIQGADPNAGMNQLVSNRNKFGMSQDGRDAGPNAQNWRQLFPNAPQPDNLNRRNLPTPINDPNVQRIDLAKDADMFLDQIIARNSV